MELEILRQEIQEIDQTLLPLFLKRMALCRAVGELKQKQHLPIENAEREKELLAFSHKYCKNEAETALLEAFYAEIFKFAKQLEKDAQKP